MGIKVTITVEIESGSKSSGRPLTQTLVAVDDAISQAVQDWGASAVEQSILSLGATLVRQVASLHGDMRDSGHGHVYPRPDGVRARCGGPLICSYCALDASRKAISDKASLDPERLTVADRSTKSSTVTRVRHVARPLGGSQENGPHLGDLREFVRAAEGLPDEVVVYIDSGNLSESGRRDVDFRLSYTHPEVEETSNER